MGQVATVHGTNALACPERLFLLGLAKNRRLGEDEENDLLTGHRAVAVVRVSTLTPVTSTTIASMTGPRFDQMRPHLLEQIPPLVGAKAT